MTKRQARRLVAESLKDAIDEWFIEVAGESSEEWKTLDCWAGPELTERMTIAAMNVLLATVDHEEFLKAEGIMRP